MALFMSGAYRAERITASKYSGLRMALAAPSTLPSPSILASDSLRLNTPGVFSYGCDKYKVSGERMPATWRVYSRSSRRASRKSSSDSTIWPRRSTTTSARTPGMARLSDCNSTRRHSAVQPLPG